MTIEDKILKYIDNHDYVTYRELEVFLKTAESIGREILKFIRMFVIMLFSGPAGMKRSFPHYCLFNHKVK